MNAASRREPQSGQSFPAAKAERNTQIVTQSTATTRYTQIGHQLFLVLKPWITFPWPAFKTSTVAMEIHVFSEILAYRQWEFCGRGQRTFPGTLLTMVLEMACQRLAVFSATCLGESLRRESGGQVCLKLLTATTSINQKTEGYLGAQPP